MASNVPPKPRLTKEIRPGEKNVPPKPRLTKELRPGEKMAQIAAIAGRTATMKPMKPVNSKAPIVGMKDDSKLLAKLPVTQAHLKTIKKYYGI